ncbi:hypothetical protein [Nocardia sp. bgisy134]|uniref:hypothetical protein n=1 Tax=Nocardia sp. bgisy134 TaxID=3413789 RepID=UPI003D71FB64
MKITKLAATSAMVAVGIIVSTQTAYGTPAPETPAIGASADTINYTAHNNGSSAIVTTDAGTLAVIDGQFQIKAADGRIVGGIPLKLHLDEIALPISATIEGNTATLTPDVSQARFYPALPSPVALPFEDYAPWKTPYDREVAAWARLTSTISTGAAVGVIIGAIGAGTVGCLAGGTLGATGGFAFLAAGAIPGAAIGCLTGAALFAPIGTLVGAIFVGAPVAIAAAIQYFSTVNAPFDPPR